MHEFSQPSRQQGWILRNGAVGHSSGRLPGSGRRGLRIYWVAPLWHHAQKQLEPFSQGTAADFALAQQIFNPDQPLQFGVLPNQLTHQIGLAEVGEPAGAVTSLQACAKCGSQRRKSQRHAGSQLVQRGVIKVSKTFNEPKPARPTEPTPT